MVNSDGDRPRAVVLYDIGGGQTVQVYNKVARSGIGHILCLLHEAEVELSDEAVRQLYGNRAGLRADDQLSGLALTGEDDIGEADLHTAGAKGNRVQVHFFNAVGNLHM